MPTVLPFAQAIADMNTAVVTMLANANAMLQGVPVSGLFDNGYATGNVGQFGMASTQSMFTLATALVPADVIGLTLTVGDALDQVGYKVVEHQPNGTGISALLLERAA